MILYFPDSTQIDITVDDSSFRYREIMGGDSLSLRFSMPQHVEIPVGTWCWFQGAKYFLSRPEDIKMRHTRHFEYTINMDSAQGKSKIWKFINNVDGRAKFCLTAKPIEHLRMFVSNMNRRDSGWEVGDCIDAVETMISYDHAYCWDALAQMAKTFKTEFEISGKRVSLRKVEYNKNNPLPLSYGRGNGFKSGVGRTNNGETPPVEILFIQGGDKNIDRSKYGSRELLLPKGQNIAFDGEHFEGEQGFNPENSRRYIVDNYGLSIRRADKEPSSYAEDSLDCSGIYPKRIGTISEVHVVESKFYDIVDSSIPDTLNYEECVIAGETMTIIFQSGMLAGREFEVKYHHASISGKSSRRFEIIQQEIDGVTMPNETFAPKTGDKYAVFNCMLPQAYICDNATKTGAEWDMLKSAVRYFFDNEENKFTFSGELDGIWAKQDWENIGGRIILGGYILFRDDNFQKEGVLIRITGIKDYINNPHSPVIEISNNTVSGGFSSEIKKLQSGEVLVEEYRKEALQFAKRRFRDAKETMYMIEQSMLENYTNSINPIAVQTMSLLVGDESLQYRFVESPDSTTAITHYFRYVKEEKVLMTDGGVIQHLTLGVHSLSPQRDPSIYKVWYLVSYVSPVLNDAQKGYYLYIKATKDNKYGEFIISEKAIKLEEVNGYYHFLVGVLNREHDGDRTFVPLYGYSEILPGRITTDRIVSSSGDSYFDMVTNAMKLGDALDFNSTGDGKLRLHGTIVQNEGGSESRISCYRGEYNDDYTYYNGDEVLYLNNGTTSTYRYINETPSKGNNPTDILYWQVSAAGAKGDDGQYTEFRFSKNGSTTTPPPLDKEVLTPTGWDITAPPIGVGEYLWEISAVKAGNGLTLIRQWSTPIRITPYDGTDGENPAMVYRGVYDVSKTYYGNKYRLDCVKFGDEFFIARIDAGTFSTPAPPDTSKWNAFGASFESIATNLLLADGANIGDWFISKGKIVSTLDDGNKIILDAVNRKVRVVSDSSGGLYSQETIGSVIDIDANTGIVETRANDGTNAVSYISPTGIFSNRAGTQCAAASTTYDQRASVVGLGKANLDKTDGMLDGDQRLIAGVYGNAFNSGTAPSYGGYFFNLKVKGLVLGQKYIDKAVEYLTDEQSLIIGISSGQCNVYLPSATREGQTIFFKQWWTGSMRIYPKGGQIIYDDHTANDYYDVLEGQMLVATFTKAYINSNETEAWLVSRFRF